MKQRVSVIIPAAGSGFRFRGGSPRGLGSKVFALLQNRPLISYSLAAFNSSKYVQEIIVALRGGERGRFLKEVLERYHFDKRILLVPGGDHRAESVRNALKKVSRESKYVCVHDAARPFVQANWLESLLTSVDGYDGAVLGKPIVPTVKQIDRNKDEVEQTLDRSCLFGAETPQLLKKDVLISAYRELGRNALHATDDTALAEAVGARVRLVPHNDLNLKITTYEDLLFARKLIVPQASLRFGIGYDRHQLVAERIFYLGGVRIHSAFGPIGHSDGDVLLHAVTDAILGALGAGDIGDLFPDTDRRWRNARSRIFLKKALEMALVKGYRPAQMDGTVILDEPRLGPLKKKINVQVAQLLGLNPDQVNLKAKTSEGLGPEQRAAGVSCQALIVLQPCEL